ncbi:MAG: imidazolonepropionase [Motiliproteus sp.]|nr:imidazolonepropionase [Motiliproteus sp.]MCW9053323.1 imidazolonepropionase [Motiliproteus sp.]
MANKIKADRVWYNTNLATMDPEIAAPYGALRYYAIAIHQDRICWIGPSLDFESNVDTNDAQDMQGFWITPGFIDCHTHLIFGGNRCGEFEQRAQGASYEEIAQAGGGILSTVAATRALSVEELAESAMIRLQALCNEGVTSVEIKSGYGLTIADELKMLKAAHQLSQTINVNIRTTLLAAHAVPPEYSGHGDDYVELICSELIPQVAERKLAQAIDVFCESIAFDLAQTERLFKTAQQHGLAIKAHCEQLSHLGGAALAARYGALSVDHGEFLRANDIKTLKKHGTVLCLLPIAHYFLRQCRTPPIDRLRSAGIPMAVASDLNPGSSPLASITLAMNMAVINFGLTPEEALLGVTRHAAKALDWHQNKGQLRCGFDADLLIWDIDQPSQLSYELGSLNLVQRVIAATHREHADLQGAVTDV